MEQHRRRVRQHGALKPFAVQMQVTRRAFIGKVDFNERAGAFFTLLISVLQRLSRFYFRVRKCILIEFKVNSQSLIEIN